MRPPPSSIRTVRNPENVPGAAPQPPPAAASTGHVCQSGACLSSASCWAPGVTASAHVYTTAHAAHARAHVHQGPQRVGPTLTVAPGGPALDWKQEPYSEQGRLGTPPAGRGSQEDPLECWAPRSATGGPAFRWLQDMVAVSRLAPRDIGSPQFSDQGRNCGKRHSQKLWYGHNSARKCSLETPCALVVLRYYRGAVGRAEACEHRSQGRPGTEQGQPAPAGHPHRTLLLLGSPPAGHLPPGASPLDTPFTGHPSPEDDPPQTKSPCSPEIPTPSPHQKPLSPKACHASRWPLALLPGP